VSQHILRKDLKRDEVRDTMLETARAIFTHEQLVAWIVGIAAVVALAVFGWQTYSERQNVKASAVFNNAMKVYDARIRAAGEPVDPNEVSYTADQYKYLDAAQKFGQVAMTYPHTRPGQLAHYYAALSAEKLGRNDIARQWLDGMAQTHDSEFAALANFALAQLDEQTGQGEQAVRLYQGLIDKPAILVPKPVAMMALADYYSKAKPAEATRLYNQVKTQYPNTPAAQRADEQLGALSARS
jgi:predicted negative regulator of RcsB-dependent stress response